MIRESGGGTKAGIANLENVLQNSNLTPEQSKNLRFLADYIGANGVLEKLLEDFGYENYAN